MPSEDEPRGGHQRALCRSLDRDVYSFPYWDDGRTGHNVTAAMRAIGFAGRGGLALVFQRFDYSFGVGALMTTATAYTSFDVRVESAVIPKREPSLPTSWGTIERGR
jgi:hypothetical protein